MRNIHYLLLSLITGALIQSSNAQIAGNKTIPGDFPSVAVAVDSLNFYGVGSGGVTMNIAAGYTETLNGRIVLRASGSSAAPIVFQKSGVGVNPVLTSYTGGISSPSAIADGFFVLAGCDYVTIDGLDLRESASNTTNLSCMEFGYALLKASAADGAQFNTIQNCTITMSRAQTGTWSGPGYFGSAGIVMLNSLDSVAGALTPVSSAGANSYNRFYANTVQNSQCGIVIVGYNDTSSPYAKADIGNDIGGSSSSTGNRILDFGCAGASPNNTSAAGVYVNSQAELNCRFNTITNTNATAALRGVYWLGSLVASSGTCGNNTVTVVCNGSNHTLSAIECSPGADSTRTVHIDSNFVSASYPTATSGACYGVSVTTLTAGTLTVNGNSFQLSSNTASGAMYAVFNTAQIRSALEVRGNTITSFNVSGAPTTAMRGIYNTGGTTGCTLTISGNTVSGVNYSGATGGSGEFSCIYNSAAVAASVISGNTLDNISAKTTGSIYAIYNSYVAPTNGLKTVQNNRVLTQLSRSATGASTGVMYGYYDNASNPSSATVTVSGNTFASMNNSPATGTVTGIHIVQTSNTPLLSVTDNAISGFTASGSGLLHGINLNGIGGSTAQPSAVRNNSVSGLSGAAAVNGIQLGSTGTYAEVNRNTIHTLSSTGASFVTGINSAGLSGSVSLTRNKIYGLSGTNAASQLNGITVSGGTTNTLANNLVGINGLSGFVATGLNSVIGLNLSGGTSVNAYHNTVYLSASGTGATFGSSGIYCASTTVLTLVNNLIVNKSVQAGSGGYSAAFRRSSGSNGVPVSTGLYSVLSNNNLFYAGIPDSTHLIYTEGVGLSNTNSKETMADYRAFMTGRDRASQSYDASTDFASVTGSTASFLHITQFSYTVLSEGGSPLSNITDDFDGDARNATQPDIGADEFNGISPAPQFSSLTVTPGGSCAPVQHVVSVDVFPSSGTVTGVILEYAFNGSLQAPVTMTNTSGITWTGTIPVASPSNASVTWNITATTSAGDVAGFNGTSYQDDPFSGASAVVTAAPGTICAGSSVSLQCSAVRTGTVSIGIGGSTATTSAANPFNNTASNGHFQYLIRASELLSAGIAPGNITSLGINILTLGSNYQVPDFSLKMANTASTTLNSAISASWTSVYSNSLLQLTGPAPLFLNLSFSTPFSWDGTSNIVLEICYGNTLLSSAMTGSVQSDATSYVSSWRYLSSTGANASTVCGTTTGNSSTGSRPKFTFNARLSVPFTALTWSTDTTVVGTSSPLSVLPAVTTTYTATMTGDYGCTLSGTVPVTVLPQVSAPLGVDSFQCGAGLPTCYVASTSGAVSPVFRWYTNTTGGTPLQSGTSATYNTSVSSTTTFYVSEFNGTCESSPRIPVVATVNTPPVISVSTTQTVCAGDSAQLSVSSQNDPNNRYTWTPGSLNGSSIRVAPATTTTYTVNALDTTSGSYSGCVVSATVTVTVIPLPGAVTVTPSSAQLCSPSGVTLTASGGSLPVVANVGAGTIRNTASSYPAPFGNAFLGARHQFLIRASELTAAGLSAGFLTSLAFDVVTPVTSVLTNFAVRIGATAITAFNPPATGFQSGLTTVYTSAAYVPSATPGYAANTFTFSAPFFWDGTSNLLIETCFNSFSSTSNATFNQSTTTYASGIGYQNNTATVCGNTNFSSVYSQRPNIRFGGLQNNSWSWSPGGATTSSISVTPSSTTTYTAVSTLNGCTAAGTATVTIPAGTFLSLSCSSRDITCSGLNDGFMSVSVSGGSGVYTSSWTNGATTDSVSGLSIGAYTVTVSDANGCTGSCSVSINMPPLLTSTATPAVSSLCGGTDSTAVTVTASGGTAPYSGTGIFYQRAGSIAYAVVDSRGCTSSNTVTVTSPRYAINAVATGNGTVSNPGTVLYDCGDSVTYVFTPNDTCTVVTGVTINSVPQGPLSSYTFNPLTISQVLIVSFGPVRYPVALNAGNGGSIQGSANPACGSDAVYTIVPNSCHAITDVQVDGVSVGPVSQFVFNDISGPHSVTATFALLTYTVTVTGGSGGSVTPSGANTYNCGDTVALTFTPDPFKVVDSVVVDGVNIGSLSSYTFVGLDSNHTVLVYFSGCAVPAEASAPTDAQLCVTNAVYTLVGSVSGAASYGLWSTSGSGVFDDIGVGTGTTYTPSAADILAGQVYLTVTTDDPDGPGDCLPATATTQLSIYSVLPVAISGPADFCAGDSVTLTASGAGTYAWSTGATTASITVSIPGNYYVDGSLLGACSATATLVVSEHPIPAVPVITPLSATEFCFGGNVSLVSSYNAGNTWQDGDTVPVILAEVSGSFFVTYTDSFGCSAVSDTVEVIVHPLPPVQIVGLDSLFCELGPSVPLTGAPSGGNFSGVGIISDIFYPGLAGIGSFLITYQYTDTNNCTGQADQLVAVDICNGIAEGFAPVLEIYPNPANDRFTVDVSAAGGWLSGYHIELTDELGRRVLRFDLSGAVNTVSTSDLAGPGVYLVRLVDRDGATKQIRRVLVY